MQRILPAFCLAISFLFSYGKAIAAAEDNTQTLESLMAEAHAAQSRGEFSQAADNYRKATALEPSIPELWANLGLMEHESGKISEAMKSFEHAARLKPSLFVPQLFLGLEYLQSDQPAAAVPYLENAVKLNPNDVQAVRSLGRVYAVLNRSENATEQYLKEVQQAPDRGDSWLDLGTSYLQQTENDARVMTSTYGDSAYVKLRAAEVFAEEGKLIDAENEYKYAMLANTVPLQRAAFAEYGITLLRAAEGCRSSGESSSTNSKLIRIAGWDFSAWRSSMQPLVIRRPHSAGWHRLRTPIAHLFSRAYRCFAMLLLQNKANLWLTWRAPSRMVPLQSI